jgi:hypothetical protein
MHSNGNTSASDENKAEENFYLGEGKKNKKRRSGNVPSSSCSCKSSRTSKERCNSDIDLDWDKTFKDAYVMDIEVVDLENGIQVENLFAFGK